MDFLRHKLNYRCHMSVTCIVWKFQKVRESYGQKKKKKKRLRDTDRSLWNKTIPVTGNG